MGNIISDTLIDLIKIIPFLYVAFLIMEYLEHKVKKNNNILKNKKVGPLVGGLLGVIPQCGFSVLGTNLFASGVITIGTLIAIYLSTSDEMLMILLTGGVKARTIILILVVKVIVAIIGGYLIDFLYKKKKREDYSICRDDDCGCSHEHNIFISSLIHTLKISFFILITTFILNILIYYLGEDVIARVLHANILGIFIASLVGLIPNCCSSVIITELYIKGVITTGMLIGGLLTGAGVGLLLLFKVNKEKRENVFIIGSLYIIGVMVGLIIDLLHIAF